MKQYASQLLRYPEMGISLDLSKLPLTPEFLSGMQPLIDRAYADIAALESGVIANPDENRMVGHYWLRNSAIAPTAELRAKIDEPLADLKAFAADVLGEEVKEASLLGLTQQQLREHSHFPQKYYGIPHFMPGFEDGEALLRLNHLRTTIRKTELSAMDAHPNRNDMLQALNRMSSAAYIMMIKLKIDN